MANMTIVSLSHLYPMTGHHISIRTGNIHQSIAFYECLGFVIEEQFNAGITLACWMIGVAGRLELIQIPEPKPAPDAFNDEHYVGYYHLAIDVGEWIKPNQSLAQWIDEFRETLGDRSLTTKMLLYPQLQTIGASIYHVAFITDTDGLPIELLLKQPT